MRMTFRQSVVATTAIIALSAMTVAAAPPGANDPTNVTPPASNTGPVPANGPDSASGRAVTNGSQSGQAAPETEQNMEARVEQRISDLHTRLNAMDNMRSYARISQQHAQDVQALLPPFQALYGKMSPSQKQTADQVFREDANRGGQAQHG